jgi:outer membrane protein TolC
MKRAIASGFFLLALWCGTSGQERMTLDQAISTGLANNYGIIISGNQVQEARNNATRGNAGMLPEIGVNAGYTKAVNNVQMDVISGSELNKKGAPSDLMTAGLGLNWRLFDGLNMFITYDKLKKIEEISELGAKITVENTVARIITAYWDIVRQEQELLMLGEQVAISQFRLDLAKMRFETGTGSEMEFLKSRVEMNADIAALSNQKTLALNAKATLNDLLSREVTTAFTVEDSIPAARGLVYDSLRVALNSQNRDLQLARKNRQVGELGVKSAAASQYPTLDYFAGMNFYRSETEAHFIQYNRYFGPTMGLTLNMKLFDGMNRKREYKNALLSLESIDLGIRQTESGLSSELFRLYNEYRNQMELTGFELQNLDLALRNMKLAKDAYATGSISSLQLREVQDDLLGARSRLITARYNVKVTETGLLLLTGGLVN